MGDYSQGSPAKRPKVNHFDSEKAEWHWTQKDHDVSQRWFQQQKQNINSPVCNFPPSVHFVTNSCFSLGCLME